MSRHYLQDEFYQLLHEEPKIFEFLRQGSLDGLWYWDLENPEHEWMDSRFWEVLGYDPAEMPHLVEAWQDIIFEEDLKIASENAQRHIDDPEHPYDQIVRYKAKTGETVWVRCRGVAIRNEEGKAIRLLGIHHNITDVKKAELAHKNNLIFHKNLLENQAVFFVRTDMKGRYIYANEFFCETFGISKDKLQGTDSMESVIPQDHEKCAATVRQCILHPGMGFRVELRKFDKDGHIRINFWEFRAITNHTGEPIEILCIGFEISELYEKQRKLEEALQHSRSGQKRLRQIAYVLSHDLRAPVANLIGLAELLSEEYSETEYLTLMKESLRHLDKLVVNLNKVSFTNRDEDLEYIEYSLIRGFQKALLFLKGEIEKHGIEVVLDIEHDIRPRLIEAYMDSIVLNLLSNAVRYRDPKKKSKISVTASAGENSVSISVKDNGIGIDLEKYGDQIFKMNKTFHDHPDSSGVGLFLAKTQTEAMGGQISVNSLPDEGTEFSIVFSIR